MSPPATGRSLLTERLALAAFLASALGYPLFMLYAEHVDRSFAEEPATTIAEVGLYTPLLLVPTAIALALTSSVWTALEKLLAACLALGWIVPYFVATADFGCDDVGGGGGVCSVTSTTTPRELLVIVVSIATMVAAEVARV